MNKRKQIIMEIVLSDNIWHVQENMQQEWAQNNQHYLTKKVLKAVTRLKVYLHIT